MATKSASRTETLIVLTTNPDLAQPFPSTGAAEAFAGTAAKKYGGTWERKMLKRICVEAQPPRAPFLCARHYYTTQATIDQAEAQVVTVEAASAEV
jgi:hypothetical protein